MVYQKRKRRGSRKREEKDIEGAKQLVLRFLSSRSRTSEEVRNRLAGQGFSPAVIEETVSRFQELGYLNDYDYALTLGRASIEHRQWGTARIRAALLHKGIASPVINVVVQELAHEYDFSQVARRALEHKFPPEDMHGPAGDKVRRQAIGYLRRRGFCWSTITDVIDSGYDT